MWFTGLASEHDEVVGFGAFDDDPEDRGFTFCISGQEDAAGLLQHPAVLGEELAAIDEAASDEVVLGFADCVPEQPRSFLDVGEGPGAVTFDHGEAVARSWLAVVAR